MKNNEKTLKIALSCGIILFVKVCAYVHARTAGFINTAQSVY